MYKLLYLLHFLNVNYLMMKINKYLHFNASNSRYVLSQKFSKKKKELMNI